MLNIFYGDMKEAVYNTASYFKYDYEDDWITDPFVKEMIQDVDQSIVLDSGVIDSPVLGKIPPTGLSGGVKTLILVKFDKEVEYGPEVESHYEIVEQENQLKTRHEIRIDGQTYCEANIDWTN